MANNNLTDSDIIQALECCMTIEGISCDDCPVEKGCISDDGVNILHKYALDLINRQQAEIENVNVYCENLKISQNHLLNELATARKTAKTEAIKEFAERLKAKGDRYAWMCGISKDEINHLVKEMTESVNYESSKTEGVVK